MANLFPFLYDPVALYDLRTDSIDEKGCQNKEQVLYMLDRCVEDLVRECLEVKP